MHLYHQSLGSLWAFALPDRINESKKYFFSIYKRDAFNFFSECDDNDVLLVFSAG